MAMSPPPRRVFVWNKYCQWRREILRLLCDLVDKSVLDQLRQNPPDYMVADNLGWLDNAIREVKRVAQSDIGTTARDRFTSHYTHLRGFHGCRAESEEAYKQDGIQQSNPALLDEIARRIFRRKDAVEVAIKDLSAGHYSYREHNSGKVCYCLQPEHLVEDCGHYLLYGSEYLSCIAARTGEEDVLRKRGRAMIIECNIPISDIPLPYLECLVGEALREIAEKYCRRPTQKRIVFGIEVHRSLKPQDIVQFHFPNSIHNPLRFGVRED